MKKNAFTIGVLAAVAFVFTSCKDEKQAQAEKTVNNYVTYVDSVGNVSADDAKANWEAIEAGYQSRVSEAEMSASEDAAWKAKLDESKAKYEALKAKYELAIKEQEAKAAAQMANTAPNFRKVLRDRLFGEGKIGDDMQFAFVTGDNILGIYKNFVDVVADNKSTYSREDWDEINVLYEALDTRKNAVEKDLKSADNMKIAGLKIRFASIAATHRGGTKVKENAEAKQ